LINYLIKISYFFYILIFLNSFSRTNLLKSDTLLNNQNYEVFNNKENLLPINSTQEIINFDNLNLIINENNKEIIQFKSRVKQANYLLKSKIAKWYPTFKLSSSGVPKYTNGFTDKKIGDNTKTDQVQNNLNAIIEWDLYNPSRNSNINSARLSLEISKIDLDQKQKDLYFESAKKFFLLQRSLQDIKIAKQSITIAEVALKEAEGRFNSGIGNKLEVLETSIQLKRDELSLSQKVGNLNSIKTELAEILGIEKGIEVNLGTKPAIIGYWSASEEESIKYALENRKDLREIGLQIEKNEQERISAIAGYKPTLTLYNNFSYSKEYGESQAINPNNQNYNRSENNTVGLKFNWLIYDGGETFQNYNVYKEREIDLNSLYSLNKIKIINEIKRNFIQLDVSIKNINTAIEQIKSSRESLKISLMRLKAGLSTQREIVNNIGDLSESEGNYVQAITDYNLNLLSLEKNTNLELIQNCDHADLQKDKLSLNSEIQICKNVSLLEDFSEDFSEEIMIDS
tara:strand:+ start:3830 stop:5371 length:1542 start_codon:yes stop_codon:yes gene_type:complete